MVFKQIVSVWQLSHPEYTDDGDSVFDKHLAGDREHDVASVAPAESVRSVETADTAGKKKRKLKVPSLHHLGIAKKQRDHGDHEGEDDDDEGGGSHEVTHCSCEDKHFKEEVLDATFATTPEKMHKLMFDSAFLTKVRSDRPTRLTAQFWAEDEGLTEVHTDAWEPSLSDNDGTRSYDYSTHPISGRADEDSQAAQRVDGAQDGKVRARRLERLLRRGEGALQCEANRSRSLAGCASNRLMRGRPSRP